MFFRQIFDPYLAQYAYLVGCQKTGDALIIDPERDVDRYLEIASAEGLRLVAAAETHIHADFLSGARELAVRHGARVYVSDAGPEDWKVEWARQEGIDAVLLTDGDRFSVGNIDLQAVYTPGHTPEHLSYLVTDRGGGAEQAMGIASGDFVFVGDLGRPDLLETAAGQRGAMEPSAHRLYDSVQRFLELPDELQVWPGHGAGSACGKALGAVPTSTVGYEKRMNSAIASGREGEDAFVAAILADQPEPPYYFARMKRENKEGPAILVELPRPPWIGASEVDGLLGEDTVFLDAREDRAAFMAGHVPGALHAPMGDLATLAGCYVEAEQDIVLVTEEAQVEGLVRQLVRIGLDRVVAWLPVSELEGVATISIDRMTFDEAAAHIEGAAVLDVRTASEFDDGHLEDAVNIAHTRLLPRLDEVPGDRRLFVHCATGARAAAAASFLARKGRDVVHVDDDFDSSFDSAPR